MKRITIYDIEKSDYYQMPKNIYKYDLKPIDRELYMLCLNNWRLSITNEWINEDGEIYFYATQDKLIEQMNVEKKTLIKAFKRLIEIGLLEVEKNIGKANKYFLMQTEESSTQNDTSSKNGTSGKSATSTSGKNDTTTSGKNGTSTSGKNDTRIRTSKKEQVSKNETNKNNSRELANDFQNEIDEIKDEIPNSLLRQEIRMLIGNKKITVDQIIALNKSFERIKLVFDFCNKHGKDEGYIIGALKGDWDLKDYTKQNKVQQPIPKIKNKGYVVGDIANWGR